MSGIQRQSKSFVPKKQVKIAAGKNHKYIDEKWLHCPVIRLWIASFDITVAKEANKSTVL